MRRNRLLTGIVTATLLLLTCVSCGFLNEVTEQGGGERTTEEENAAISGRDEIEDGTVQIVSEGSFVDPASGEQTDSAGAGSGFIIDPSGIAVTNNHVVTGSAFLNVYTSEGGDEPINAKVLGVSECSDLAVIDLEGGGYPYFDWRTGPVDVGLDVYAAGFPLGDPEFTLTRGIVSKAEADGETNWSSIDYVIEHDATINPGNSGGPLVDDDGRVVGVDYATSTNDVEGGESNQYFAISETEAIPVIKQLRAGEDVESIGINGEAFITEDESVSGIYVYSVESGSPADEAGVKGGDILTTMEGKSLGDDGTMADYCDILRGNDPEDTLSIEVYRIETDETLVGQLNGRELEVVKEPEPTTGSGGSSAAEGYTSVQDDTGALTMDVPNDWTDVDGGTWVYNEEEVGPGLTAAPDVEAFNNNWDAHGAFFGASEQLYQNYTVDSLLDELNYSQVCTDGGRTEYADGYYTGRINTWENCDDTGAGYLTLVATPDNGNEFVVVVEITVIDDSDVAAAEQIEQSFDVIGDL